MKLQQFFNIGLKRYVPELLENHGFQIELGPGNSPVDPYVDGAVRTFELPDWNAEIDPIPLRDNSVDTIHAYHFFEHLDNFIDVMKECQRVLIYGGHMNIVVPFYKSEIAYEDPDHKRVFTEGTWQNLIDNKGYNRDGFKWELQIHFNMIMGIAERNLAIFTQMVKL